MDLLAAQSLGCLKVDTQFYELQLMCEKIKVWFCRTKKLTRGKQDYEYYSTKLPRHDLGP